MPFDYLSNDLIIYIFTLIVHDHNVNLFNFEKKNLQYLLLININCKIIAEKMITLKYYNLKCEYIDKFIFPKKIVKLFKNYYNIYRLPILKFSNKYQGYTDCIDNIKNNNVSNKIMIGFDYFKRPFFTFKLEYFNIKTKKINYKISILYQRYSNDYNYWIFESYYANNFHDIFEKNDNFLKLTKILQGEKIKYKNYLVYI